MGCNCGAAPWSPPSFQRKSSAPVLLSAASARRWLTDPRSNSCSCSVGCLCGVCMRCLTAWAARAAGPAIVVDMPDAPVDVLARLGDSLRGVACQVNGLLDDLVHHAGT